MPIDFHQQEIHLTVCWRFSLFSRNGELIGRIPILEENPLINRLSRADGHTQEGRLYVGSLL